MAKAKNQPESVLGKAKSAALWAKDSAVKVAGKSVETAVKVKDKSRDSLNKAYEAKLPVAKEVLSHLRSENPKAGPYEVQLLLDDQLRNAEQEFGGASVEFSTAVSLYVVASLELHEMDDDDTDIKHQKLMDLMVILDSSAVKFTRKAVGVAAAAVMLVPAARATKGVLVAQKVVIKSATLAAATKTVLSKGKLDTKISNQIIARTGKVLGPASKVWKQSAKPKKTVKPATKPKKK
ncbi:MAG: hypothetical protein RL523_285 [Actinomycetota bacterium]|jgi:hypothetical protein